MLTIYNSSLKITRHWQTLQIIFLQRHSSSKKGFTTFTRGCNLINLFLFFITESEDTWRWVCSGRGRLSTVDLLAVFV